MSPRAVCAPRLDRRGVVVGDLSKIEKPVRALNFGEVTVLDTDGKPVVR